MFHAECTGKVRSYGLSAEDDGFILVVQPDDIPGVRLQDKETVANVVAFISPDKAAENAAGYKVGERVKLTGVAVHAKYHHKATGQGGKDRDYDRFRFQARNIEKIK